MMVTADLVRAEWAVSQLVRYRYLGRNDWNVTVEFSPNKPDRYWISVYRYPPPLATSLSVAEAYKKAVELRQCEEA